METLFAYSEKIINTLNGNSFLNAAWQWVLALTIAVLVYFICRFFLKAFIKKIDKIAYQANNKIYYIAINALKNSKLWFFAAIAIFLGAKVLKLGQYDYIPQKILLLATFIQVGIWISIIFRGILKNWSRKNGRNSSQNTVVAITMVLSKFFIWLTILLLILDNLGVKVVSLLAGLGIGGIAIALAAQKILGDLFASISIVIDKPFEVGDLINLDSIIGTVESIGIKTTRVRSITGEQIVIANGDLLESRVTNLKRMQERRITLNISVSNQTSRENLHAIVDTVKDIIDNQSDARFDRGHLKGFSASSIDYEFVFWVTKPEYVTYMDVQQKINLSIIDAFSEREINLAYSTQKVLLEKN